MRELFTAPPGEGKSETGDGVGGAGCLGRTFSLDTSEALSLPSMGLIVRPTKFHRVGWRVFLEKLFLQTLNPSGLLSEDTRRGTKRGGGNPESGRGLAQLGTY